MEFTLSASISLSSIILIGHYVVARVHFVVFIAKITDIFVSLSLSLVPSTCRFLRLCGVYYLSAFVCVRMRVRVCVCSRLFVYLLLAPLNKIELSQFEFPFSCFDLNSLASVYWVYHVLL